MAEFVESGWVKWHRSYFTHPVRKRPAAAMTFEWMVAAAAHRPRVDRSFARPVELERGQLVTSWAELPGVVPFSAKQIRSAVAWLEREEMIRRVDLRSHGCSLVTIVNYEQYQGRADDSLHGEGENFPPENGQTNGHTNGHTADAKKGRLAAYEKRLSRKGKCDVDWDGRADRNGGKGQANGQTNGHTHINKDEEVKKIKKTDPPNPPLEKGGLADASAVLGTAAECRDMVLAMWREAWDAAGEPIADVVGRNNSQGAETLARDYLQAARLTPAQLRAGIGKLVAMRRSDPKCRQYDLRTLAKNPDKYCPPIVLPKKERKLFVWEYVCDVCGATCSTRPDSAEDAPPAQPCIRGERGCQGTMYAGNRRNVEL